MLGVEEEPEDFVSVDRLRVFVPRWWKISYPTDSRHAQVRSAIIVVTGDELLPWHSMLTAEFLVRTFEEGKLREDGLCLEVVKRVAVQDPRDPSLHNYGKERKAILCGAGNQSN